MTRSVFYGVVIISLILIAFSYYNYLWVHKKHTGNAKMRKISSFVSEGSLFYIKQQSKTFFKVLTITFIFIVILINENLQELWTAIIILTSGFFSAFTGFLSIKIVAIASEKAANAVRWSTESAFKIAIRGGAVSGLLATGLLLLNISICYLVIEYFLDVSDLSLKTMIMASIMLTFILGISINTFLTITGNMIFSKTAVICEYNVKRLNVAVSENGVVSPAVILKSIGNSIVDTGVIVADLYESYAGSLLGTMLLAVYANKNTDYGERALLAPIIIASIGGLFSLLGILLIKFSKNKEGDLTRLVLTLAKRSDFVTILMSVFVFYVFYYIGIDDWIKSGLSVIFGLIGGNIIGAFMGYFASTENKPVQNNYIILPIIVVTATTISSFALGLSGSNTSTGTEFLSGAYFIGLSAVGMLSTLPLILTANTLGSIINNATGIAQFTCIEDAVSKRAEKLKLTGNISSSVGKGYCTGAAFQTAVVLLMCVVVEAEDNFFSKSGINFHKLFTIEKISPFNPYVITGFLIGILVVFWFLNIFKRSLNNVLFLTAREVKEQFSKVSGGIKIKEKLERTDYIKCVAVSAKQTQRETIKALLIVTIPAMLVIVFLKMPGVMGFFAGALSMLLFKIVFVLKKKKNVDKFIYYKTDCFLEDLLRPLLNTIIKFLIVLAVVFMSLSELF